MVTIATFLQMALSFEGVTEQPHFEKTSFRVNKKIFATLDFKTSIAVLKLSLTDQSVFCSFCKAVVYPVPGKWGLQGATMIKLKTIKKMMLKDMLTISYCNTAPKKLAERYRQK